MGKIRWHGKEIEQAVNKLLRKKLGKASLHTVAEIKKVMTEKGIVKTGRARSSMSFTMDDNTTGGRPLDEDNFPDKPNTNLTSFIGTTVFYDPFLEFGTRHQAARPHIRPGFERAKKGINKIFGTKEKL